jgi:hypothetical protein
LELFCADHFQDCLIVRLPALFGEGLKKNFLFDLMNPVPSMLPLSRFETFVTALGPKAAEPYHHDPALGMMVLDRAALEASGARASLEAAVIGAGFSAVEFTNPASQFQFYQMSRLASDIHVGLAAGLPILHLAPEPVAAADVYRTVTGRDMATNPARVHREDMRTQHAGLWGRSGPYIDDRDGILTSLRKFMSK